MNGFMLGMLSTALLAGLMSEFGWLGAGLWLVVVLSLWGLHRLLWPRRNL